MTTPCDIENLRAVFQRVMQIHQLSPKDVRNEGYIKTVPDKGAFQCDNCHRFWSSFFSWVSFDLKELEIHYRWKMKCKHCLLDCIPKFTVEQLERMFGKAVLYYKGERSPAEMIFVPRGQRRNRKEPHHPDLCEMCIYGRPLNCWHKSHYTS